MPYEYYQHMYSKGAEAGGGTAFPNTMRICPGGQSQSQVDPKQQQQPVQSGIQMSFSQATRPTTQLYPRASTRLNAPRAHMISQPVANTNMQYSTGHAMLLPPYGPVILPPHTMASGRHQSHGGGQGAGSGATPANVGTYYAAPSQPQHVYATMPSHPPPIPAAFAQYPYMFQTMRNNSYPAQNPGQHPGATTPQPPQHQPQQQYVVDGGVRATGGSSGGGGVSQTGAVIMQPPHISQQPPQSQPRQRRTHAIPIVNPNSGKDITEELYQEKTGEPSATTTLHSVTHGERECQDVGSGAKVAAEFAAKVAAAAVAPAEVGFQAGQPPLAGSVNGPSNSPPPSAVTPPAELQAVPTHISLQPAPVIAHPPAQIVQPPPPPTPQAQIPTVSAKTDSPPVDLPSRPKGPTHSPGRKTTPIPSSAPPVLDAKKKEKKVHGLGSTLSPHREEPEEVRKPSFEDSINIKNFKPVPVPPPTPQLPQPVTVVASVESETNGEPEVAAHPAVPPQSQLSTVKHPERQEQQTLQTIHERGKTLPKKATKGGKKAGAGKEQNRRWQEKVGGSDMDAFVGGGAPSNPPASEPAAPSPPPSAADSEPAPPPTQPPSEDQLQPDEPASPTPSANVNSQNEDVVEAMDDTEEVEEELMLVAAKNEENVNISSAALTDNEEIVNETPVIGKAKPALKYTYKEGQWSPLNPDGKRVYDRDFLLILRSDHLSTKRPDIEDCDIIKTDSTNNNNISANNNNNNRRPLHGSNSMSMSREIFAPNYLKSSSSQRGPGMMGKRSSQQGRAGRDSRNKGYPSQQYKDALDGELHWAKSGGWKPDRCKTPPKLNEDETKTMKLYKNVRGILNKLTPQKFDTLMDQILQLPIDTIERLTGVVGLIIDKAVDEPSFSRAYAKLCQNINKLAIKSAEGDLAQSAAADISFRKILLTKCQQMFEKKKREGKEGDEGKKSDEERIAELQQQVSDEDNKEKKKELQLILEEEERKIRVKYVGLARFIGELFKLNMLTSKIMFGCISTLLEKIEEESLECLCKLLSTVGKELEAQAKTQPGQSKELDDCFAKMKKLSQKSANSKVSSRVRFMLQDVIELRSNKWVPRREDNNPKTMEQIQRDAERETMMESALLQASNTPRNKHSDRGDDRRRGGPRGGGGSVTDSEGWVSARFKNQAYNFEPSKLQHLKGVDSEPGSQNLGSCGQFRQWGFGSTGPKLQSTDQRSSRGLEYTNKFAILSGDEKKNPPSVSKKTTSSSLEKERAVQSVREALTSDKSARNFSSNPPSRDSSRARGSAKPMASTVADQEPQSSAIEQREPEDPEVAKKKAWVLFEEWQANHNEKESTESINEAFPEAIVFVKNVMEKVIEGKESQRLAFGELLGALLSLKMVSPLDLAKELGELIEMGEDLMIDLPFVWKYLAEFLVPIMGKGVFTFADFKVACQSTRTPQLSKTLAEIINRLLKEKGPVFIKNQWESSKVVFSDFIPEIDVDNFIKNNNYGFIIGEGELEAKEPLISMTEVEKILHNFLIQDSEKVSDHVCEWVKANVGTKSQDVDFIKSLVRAVIKACIKNGKIVPASLNKHSILIRKFIDSNEKRELACLNGIMHLIVNEMEAPSGLLLEIFQSLNENNIISYEAFLKWKATKNEPGKGVALTSLSSFYVSLSEQDETDEEST